MIHLIPHLEPLFPVSRPTPFPTSQAPGQTLVPSTAVAVFAPASRGELQGAVDSCIDLSIVGQCPKRPNRPIGSCDVSSVTDITLSLTVSLIIVTL